MIKVSETVRDIIYSSEDALIALSKGYLNLSAYAKYIQKETEQRAKKEVKPGSIVIALSRITRQLDKQKPLLPDTVIRGLSTKSGLVEITFPKTQQNRETLKLLYNKKEFMSADFFTVTQGVSEISIILSSKLKDKVLSIFKGQKPTLAMTNLASLTINYDEDCIVTPNITYAMTRQLAIRRINIVEIVSTFTELTFILYQKDLEQSFLMFNHLFEYQE